MSERHRIAPVCGGCGSSRLNTTIGTDTDTAYGVCLDCERLQELETRAEPCQQMCDNCAYRRDSDERADPWAWAEHRDRHIDGGQPFYCHKGLPLGFDPRGSTHVIDSPDTIAEALRKPCAGWMAARLAHCHKKDAS